MMGRRMSEELASTRLFHERDVEETHILEMIHKSYVTQSSIVQPSCIFRFLYRVYRYGVRDCLYETRRATRDENTETTRCFC